MVYLWIVPVSDVIIEYLVVAVSKELADNNCVLSRGIIQAVA